MPNILDADGLETATQAELISNATTSLQTIYGPDINLSSDTPDGQLVNIQIQSTLDVQDLMTQVYNSFDPDLAIGDSLDQRVAINGIQRHGGTYTITNLTITTTSSVNLFGLDQSVQPVYTASDASGNQWQLLTTASGVTVGVHVFSFRAANPGAVQTIPNTINVPISVVLGVSSINNPTTYSVLGLNEETDFALRIRRSVSTSLSSQGYYRGLRAALLNINGVQDAFVYENDSASTDVNGVPGHSIWVIVDGSPAVALTTPWSSVTTYAYGNIASSGGFNYISWQNNNTNNAVTNPLFWGLYNPIAQAIYVKRNAGCGMLGSINYSVTQDDGIQFVVRWDPVIPESIFIKFTASSLDGVHSPNISGILTQLPIIYAPGVDNEVNINQLATLVQQIDANTLVTNAGFSTSLGGSYTPTLTPTAKNYQFAVESANIVIIPMILTAPFATPVIVSGAVTQTEVTVVHPGTIQFTGLGGHLAYTFAMVSGAGSVNASSGLYTSLTAGTDTVRVTDSLGNTAISVVTVT